MFVFAAVGFETTAPVYAMLLKKAKEDKYNLLLEIKEVNNRVSDATLEHGNAMRDLEAAQAKEFTERQQLTEAERNLENASTKKEEAKDLFRYL